MKKKIIFIGIIILVVLLFIFINHIANNPNEYLPELSIENKEMIIESSYINYAWGFTYNGIAIYNDGSVYKWDSNDSSEGIGNVLQSGKIKRLSKWILENGELQPYKINKTDVKKLINYISNLEDSISTHHTAYDAGSSSISAIKYSDNKTITLVLSGDYSGINNTINSIQILNILNKYGLYNKTSLIRSELYASFIFGEILLILKLLIIPIILLVIIKILRKRKVSTKKIIIICSIIVISVLAVRTLIIYLKRDKTEIIPSSSEILKEDLFEFNDSNRSITGIKDKNVTNIVIPKEINGVQVQKIGAKAFYQCRDLENVEIPDSVTTIDIQAFADCTNLEKITIPNSVSRIGRNAFYNCRFLDGIELPNDINIIEASTFEGCANIRNITIPDSVTIIGDGAFKGCSQLESIEVPSNITKINYNAFSNCTNLKSIKLADNIIYIGESAFEGCANLNNIEIPSNVTSIGSKAFYYCTSLESIKIPKNVNSIGISAFGGCKSLNSIMVESENEIYDSRNNCNAIIKTNNNELIIGCQNTKIPDSILSIGNGAFENCQNLQTIDIPNSVQSIGDKAFYECTMLSSIIIPNSVKNIGESAFYFCRSLKDIEIPSSVLKIGKVAFSTCNMKTVTVRGTNLSYVGKGAFQGGSQHLTIYVADEKIQNVLFDSFSYYLTNTTVEIDESLK